MKSVTDSIIILAFWLLECLKVILPVLLPLRSPYCSVLCLNCLIFFLNESANNFLLWSYKLGYDDSRSSLASAVALEWYWWIWGKTLFEIVLLIIPCISMAYFDLNYVYFCNTACTPFSLMSDIMLMSSSSSSFDSSSLSLVQLFMGLLLFFYAVSSTTVC